jgi:hypothetical protein
MHPLPDRGEMEEESHPHLAIAPRTRPPQLECHYPVTRSLAVFLRPASWIGANLRNKSRLVMTSPWSRSDLSCRQCYNLEDNSYRRTSDDFHSGCVVRVILFCSFGIGAGDTAGTAAATPALGPVRPAPAAPNEATPAPRGPVAAEVTGFRTAHFGMTEAQVSTAIEKDLRVRCRSIHSPATSFWNIVLSRPSGALVSISSTTTFCLKAGLISRLFSRSVPHDRREKRGAPRRPAPRCRAIVAVRRQPWPWR